MKAKKLIAVEQAEDMLDRRVKDKFDGVTDFLHDALEHDRKLPCAYCGAKVVIWELNPVNLFGGVFACDACMKKLLKRKARK